MVMPLMYHIAYEVSIITIKYNCSSVGVGWFQSPLPHNQMRDAQVSYVKWAKTIRNLHTSSHIH